MKSNSGREWNWNIVLLVYLMASYNPCCVVLTQGMYKLSLLLNKPWRYIATSAAYLFKWKIINVNYPEVCYM